MAGLLFSAGKGLKPGEGQISVWHKNIWTKKLKYREDKNVAISTIASFEYDTVRLYPQ